MYVCLYVCMYVWDKSVVYSISTTLLKYLETNPFESMLPAELFILILGSGEHKKS